MPIDGAIPGMRISVRDMLALHLNPVSRFHAQQNPDSRLPGPNPGHEEFNWRTVTPILDGRWLRQVPEPSAFTAKFNRILSSRGNGDRVELPNLAVWFKVVYRLNQ